MRGNLFPTTVYLNPEQRKQIQLLSLTTGIINQGHGNQTARAIQVRRDETVNKKAFIKLIQAVVANNRAGGWRKLKSKG